MNVLFLEEWPRFVGGSERMSLALCGHAARRGHHVSMAYARPGDMVDAYARAGARVHQIPATPIAVRHLPTALRSITALANVVRRGKADVVFTSQVNYVSLLAAVGQVTGARTGVHLGLVYNYPSPVFRTGARLIDLAVAPSEQSADGWRQKDWPSKSLRVIANGVDTQVFHPGDGRAAARRRQSLDGVAGPLVAYVGRLVPEKGIFTLLEAFARYRRAAGAGHLLYVGQPGADEISQLGRRAHDAGLKPGDWTVRPAVATPEDVYRSADLVVAPSEWDEPFGLSPLEALACGTMTVVSDRGVLPTFVAPVGDSAVFPSGDIDALRRRLTEWLSADDRREASARALAAHASSRFGLDRCGDEYLAAFSSMVES